MRIAHISHTVNDLYIFDFNRKWYHAFALEQAAKGCWAIGIRLLAFRDWNGRSWKWSLAMFFSGCARASIGQESWTAVQNHFHVYSMFFCPEDVVAAGFRMLIINLITYFLRLGWPSPQQWVPVALAKLGWKNVFFVFVECKHGEGTHFMHSFLKSKRLVGTWNISDGYFIWREGLYKFIKGLSCVSRSMFCWSCTWTPGSHGKHPTPRGPVGTEGIPAKAEVQSRDGRSKFPWSA